MTTKRVARVDGLLRASVACAGVVLLVGAAIASSADTSGRVLYLRYCASCHGREGRGDGPVASALSPRATDLTRLDLDVRALMRAIGGSTSIAAHGTAAMPVWGEVLSQAHIGDPHRRRTALLELQAISEYVHDLRKPRE